MTPEMRRVVAEAEAAARNGWSGEAVKSLTEAAHELRCDADEVAPGELEALRKTLK